MSSISSVAVERKARAWVLRKEGHSIQDIATILGISRQAASKYCKDTIHELNRQRFHDAELVQTEELELARQDLLQLNQTILVYPPLHKDIPRLFLVRTRIREHVARLLRLVQPISINMGPTDPNKARVEAITRSAEAALVAEEARDWTPQVGMLTNIQVW